MARAAAAGYLALVLFCRLLGCPARAFFSRRSSSRLHNSSRSTSFFFSLQGTYTALEGLQLPDASLKGFNRNSKKRSSDWLSITKAYAQRPLVVRDAAEWCL
ncbi:hypothetical protein GDO78_021400 [Eleutherodactylus coqui]|uniref:Secreted protein n=1 Tax=Eleutherodactylus coqui TaxID=57060 RepID=A0A8J6BIY6_ELECQ|nr:hypothetical protein GDO78_021400 [Eleutherodactylus coqui]